jgi:hypothetical protein
MGLEDTLLKHAGGVDTEKADELSERVRRLKDVDAATAEAHTKSVEQARKKILEFKESLEAIKNRLMIGEEETLNLAGGMYLRIKSGNRTLAIIVHPNKDIEMPFDGLTSNGGIFKEAESYMEVFFNYDSTPSNRSWAITKIFWISPGRLEDARDDDETVAPMKYHEQVVSFEGLGEISDDETLEMLEKLYMVIPPQFPITQNENDQIKPIVDEVGRDKTQVREAPAARERLEKFRQDFETISAVLVIGSKIVVPIDGNYLAMRKIRDGRIEMAITTDPEFEFGEGHYQNFDSVLEWQVIAVEFRGVRPDQSHPTAYYWSKAALDNASAKEKHSLEWRSASHTIPLDMINRYSPNKALELAAKLDNVIQFPQEVLDFENSTKETDSA